MLFKDIWPTGEHIKVFACIEGATETVWILREYADTQAAEESFKKYQSYSVASYVNAGSRVMYVYLNEKANSEESEMDETQMSLFE